MIAATEANHPHLTTRKTLCVEISRARDRAELVTDDAKALREQLEAATGERIEAVEPERAEALSKGAEAAQAGAGQERDGGEVTPKDGEPTMRERGKYAGMDLGR